MPSPNLSEVVTTTLRNRSKKIVDNVSNNNALLQRITARGRSRPADGGRSIVQELDYQENATFAYYSGYEPFNLTPADVLSAAEFPWKQAVVIIQISGLEGDIMNSGPSAVMNLLESRMENAERTMANKLSQGIYSDGTGTAGKQITGLQAHVADSPATGIVGNIDAAAFSFWRNKSFDATTDGGAAASASNIRSYMQKLYTQCVRGNDAPDLMPADLNYFGFYWDSLAAIQRIERTDRAEGGWRALAFAGGDVFYDGDSGIPVNHMYMINTNYVYWRPHPRRNMVPLAERASLNQDATVVPLVFAGNLTSSNRDMQGVLKD